MKKNEIRILVQKNVGWYVWLVIGRLELIQRGEHPFKTRAGCVRAARRLADMFKVPIEVEG